jgi:hypothetical protein
LVDEASEDLQWPATETLNGPKSASHVDRSSWLRSSPATLTKRLSSGSNNRVVRPICSDVRERPIDITMRFKSFVDYWDAVLLGQGPAGSYVGRLDQNKLPALRSEVKRRLRPRR